MSRPRISRCSTAKLNQRLRGRWNLLARVLEGAVDKAVLSARLTITGPRIR